MTGFDFPSSELISRIICESVLRLTGACDVSDLLGVITGVIMGSRLIDRIRSDSLVAILVSF